jgi:DNA repair exonuclease SbcCD ATPase subunit
VRIFSLHVRDLRRHRDLDIAFASGLTVVRGPNESGKSTIQRAIELALFRKPTSVGADIEGLRPWGTPEDARPEVTLAFEDEQQDDDGRMRVRSGTLVKSFRGPRGTVRLEVEGEVVTDPALADEMLAEMTGIPSEAFYAATASIHHRAIDIPREDAALRDRLQSSISGGDRGTSQAKRRLEVAVRGLTSQGTKNPGRLRVAEQAVAQAQEKLRVGEEGLARLEADRDALGLAREKRAQAEETRAERRALLEKARQAERLMTERDVARERYQRFRTAVEVSEEIERMESSHPSATPLQTLDQIAGRLHSLDGRARELRAALGEILDVDYEVQASVDRSWVPVAILVAVAVVAGLAGLILGLAQQVIPVAIAGGVLVVVGAFVAIIAERRRATRGQIVRARELREAEISRRLRGRSELEAELRQCEADIAAQLANLDLPDIAAADALVAAEREHVAAIGRLRAQLDGLVGREPLEALEGMRDAAALEIEQKTAALEGLGPIAKEPRARERLEVEVRDVEASLERARDDEAGARARLDANPVDAEQVAGEAERLTAWLEELDALRRRERVYGLALAALVAAETATMRSATRFLETRMRDDLPRLTGGRYRRVEIDDRSLDIRVFAPERGDFVGAAELSEGTFDQVLLAARLGLVRFVLRGRRPPLLLDDPFVTFDDARAERAAAAVRDLARDFQVVLFTTSDRYDMLADAVVDLAGPTLRDVEAPPPTPSTPPARPAGKPQTPGSH